MSSANLRPGRLDLELYQRDTRTLPLEFRNSDGTPVVLPTSGWLCQVRRMRDGGAILLTITVTATDAAAGNLSLALPAASFKRGFWDLQNTTGGVVRTWLQGEVTVLGDVSNA